MSKKFVTRSWNLQRQLFRRGLCDARRVNFYCRLTIRSSGRSVVCIKKWSPVITAADIIREQTLFEKNEAEFLKFYKTEEWAAMCAGEEYP